MSKSDFKILAIDDEKDILLLLKYNLESEGYLVKTATSGKEGIKIADFITIHMPLNKDTMDLIKKDEFIVMKENCILVNTARGGIINETDLLWALKNKKIRGAGLDVFKEEPPLKSSPLFQLDNIVLSPHNAALTLECRKRMAVESAENIVNFLVNKSELNYNNIVNKENLSL